MKANDLKQRGLQTDAVNIAMDAQRAAHAAGYSKQGMETAITALLEDPEAFLADPVFGALAQRLHHGKAPESNAPFRQWGEHLDFNAVEQMVIACRLPVAVRGALMPDAHLGYGVPIGGVLATRGAVIPYAVGVDIACRMKLTVLDRPLGDLAESLDTFKKAIETETRFGLGAEFSKKRRQHGVMDADWRVSPVTAELKDKAWKQLGTSGGGNHFAEFGELVVTHPASGLAPGNYLALLSHSGSRGTGSAVCTHYSKLAVQTTGRTLQQEFRNLSWLDLDSEAGQEYWAAMELMGQYAAANHACIHRHIAASLGASVLLDVENHHNFAWKETHFGEEVVVHRKGATPAGEGVLGIIPGSMATPGFLVRGKGNAESMDSASHGAGRAMSRTQAKKQLNWTDTRAMLQRNGVTLMTAGLDEVPMAYKDIETVMAAQDDLVEVLAAFHPRLVKMAPEGSGAED